MVQVIRKYKLLFILLSLLILAAAIWLAFIGPGFEKVPSRGVFVFNGTHKYKMFHLVA